MDKKRIRLNKKLFKISKLINITIVKFNYLVKQKKFLAAREAEIIRRSLKNVDKLEKLKIQKKTEKTVINNTGFFLSFDLFSLELFEISIFFFFENFNKTAAIVSDNL